MNDVTVALDEARSDERLSERLAARMVAQRAAAGIPEVRAREGVDRLRASAAEQGDWRSYTVRAAGEPVGTADVWDMPTQGPLLVHLDAPPELLTAALRALADEARARGQRRLSFSAIPGPLDLADAAAGLQGVLEATRMQLDLSVEPGPATVRLDPMSPEEYDAFHGRSVTEYADDLLSTGAYPTEDAARAESERQFDQLLPDGLASPGQYLFTATADGVPVGLLWLFLEDDWCFVYDVRMEDDQRGRGHGTGTMNAGAHWSRRHGATLLGLNVFGANTGARRLYERLGYATVERFFHLDL